MFIISRSKEKEGNEISGYKFTITIEKSRFVVEKSKLPFQVSKENGFMKFSGLLDLALEAGVVVKPSNGWYSRVNDDGTIEESKHRLKQTNNSDFWKPILANPFFESWIKKKFQLNSNLQITEDNINDDEETDSEVAE
jgi:hypothetical protein